MRQPATLATRQVVVVDDDHASRESLSALLQDYGYEVISVANGREALDYLADSAPPIVIILDLVMPVMDGWEFLERQSHDLALHDIPVVVLTGTPPQGALKAKAVLRKPVHFQDLVEIVERVSRV
jgi:CheY-like chemotaxis protein